MLYVLLSLANEKMLYQYTYIEKQNTIIVVEFSKISDDFVFIKQNRLLVFCLLVVFKVYLISSLIFIFVIKAK